VTDELSLREPEGTISVPAATLNRIVAAAAELVDGVRVRRPRRSVDIALADGSATVTLHLVARYGTVLPMVAEEVQREVASALERMCDLEIERVDVAVEELV
jgi:uncharacterized alkaline shock family protein YloU